MEFKLNTPVAFFVFNRPDTTRRVFEEIRIARPSKLLLVVDGPRMDKDGEAEKCEAVRTIIDTVDWPCEVLKNYSEINLGCKKRVSSGIDWVFNEVEEAIILEDDCLPNPTFFRFCEELLEKYRYDERIGMISGDNYLRNLNPRTASYYFSIYPHIWGWASWRRAWKHYDVNMKSWKHIDSTSFLKEIHGNNRAELYWKNIFHSVYEGKIDTWDYQWVYTCWKRRYLSVTAGENLVSNIGFGNDATHIQNNKFADMENVEMRFPLYHLVDVIRDYEADNYIEKNNFSGTIKWWIYIILYLKKFIGR